MRDHPLSKVFGSLKTQKSFYSGYVANPYETITLRQGNVPLLLDRIAKGDRRPVDLDAIRAAATLAPFGHGSKTTFDEDFRGAFEIQAEDLIVVEHDMEEDYLYIRTQTQT